MKLRDYQDEAIESVVKAYQRGTNRSLVCLATGLGKTVIIAALPLYIKPSHNDTMLVLVNRDELVGQTVSKLKSIHCNKKIGIEKAGLEAEGDCEFVVGSVQTLRGERLEEFYRRFRNKIGILVVDECHHATAESYRRIIEKFFEKRHDGLLVGVTATPQRSDGEGLGSVFDEVVFHRDIQWAIENGYLVPVRCFKVTTNVQLDKVSDTGNDFAIGELGETIDLPSRNNIIVSAYIQHTNNKKAIAFCATVKQAEHLAQAFNERGINAAWASGNSTEKDRLKIVKDFRNGHIRVLANCGLYLEGFDVPDAEVMIGARPTQSTALYVQMTGRVLRPLDNIAEKLEIGTDETTRRNFISQSQKPWATVLDIVDQTKRHSLRTLPTLWGMPPGLATQGENITEVCERYKELAAKDPATAKNVKNLVEIKTAIEAVNIFAIPRIEQEVAEISSLAWRVSGENRYRLGLPSFYQAKMPDGSNIINFGRKYRAKLSEARHKGAFPYDKYAQEQIGFDSKTFSEYKETLEIRPGILDAFQVMLERKTEQRILGSVPSLHEAFTRAERWIEHNRSDLTSALSTKALWRKKDISQNQLRVLRDTFNVPMHLIPETQGEATLLISKLYEEKRFAQK